MADHIEILEAALSALHEGIIVLDNEQRIVFWNPAATAMAGYASAEMLGRPLPEGFYEVDLAHHGSSQSDDGSKVESTAGNETGIHEGLAHQRPVLVNICHQRHHTFPAMLHRTPLRDPLGARLATMLRFHTVEEIDTLLHGECSDDGATENRLEHSQAGIEDRLDEASREWVANGIPFGVMWVLVDQAANLRKTHGRDASESMMDIVEKSLLHGLRPTEILGRWGSNEFLVLSHERTIDMLDAHGRYLAGITRTADFRWWGDRVGLTVSIGVAQAQISESLSCLLKRAQKAMHSSQYSGGNCVTHLNPKDMANTGGQECLQS